jgi:glycosyltransferase involved in cell wall biosynthesis
MWNKEKVSVVIPARNEEETVREIITEVFATGVVDEIIVVDNNSTDKTKDEILKTKARYVFETQKGYGNALRRGIKEATGDFIVFFDADGNFPAEDILKLLPYTDRFDFVKGTRARKELTEVGIYPPIVSWLGIVANFWVSKLQQLLFCGPAITDAGCTLRLHRTKQMRMIEPYFTVGTGHFLAEVTNLAMIARIKMLEVPVNFTKRRGGVSKHGSFWGLFKIMLRMIRISIAMRFKAWFGFYKFPTSH